MLLRETSSRRLSVIKSEHQTCIDLDKLTTRHRGVGKKSPYTISFPAQVVAIAKRQTILKYQDKFGLYTSYGTSIIIALIVGSVYFRLPESASGKLISAIQLTFRCFHSRWSSFPWSFVQRSYFVLGTSWSNVGSTYSLPTSAV